ncbi:MAG: FAD-dependent oxidoreductase [candidate division WS1 bacterium]|nr:FAD-dependent oxidoreductase [candidate division WS1 bacterium]
MPTFDALFSPGSIGTLQMPNRIIMAPMGTNYADPAHHVTDRLIAYHVARARGGVGLQIVEHTAVHPFGLTGAKMLAIYDDEMIPGLRRLTDAVHQAGGRIALQLQHGGRQANAAVIGRRPLSPSAVSLSDGNRPEKMTEEEIREAVEAFGEGARRAMEAGFDGVEVHMAHGYLGCSFLSPLLNRRDDDWGGDTERRTRFAREVRAAIVERCGEDFPCWCRISANEFVEGGTDLDEAKRFAPMLAETGYQAIHVSAAIGETARYASAPYYIEHGHLIEYAEGIREVVDVPVIGVGRILRPEMADGLIREGRCDFVALGRALLADPDWPRKSAEGRVNEIIPCIGCNLGCLDRRYSEQAHCQCTVNPWTGREVDWPGYPDRAVPDEREPARGVLVIGAGPGGMQAAIVAAHRGHEVTIWERSDHVGGTFALAAMAPGKAELAGLIEWQKGELERLGVEIQLNTHATVDSVLQFDPDNLIVATGSTALGAESLPFGGGARYLSGDRILRGEAQVRDPVYVISSRGNGSEIAHLLAEQGHAVTLLESGEDLAPLLPSGPRTFLLQRLEELGVKILTGHRALGLDAEGIMADVGGSERRFNDPGTVVLAIGRRSNDDLAGDLEVLPITMTVIGDAERPRHAQAAVHEGALAGREI